MQQQQLQNQYEFLIGSYTQKDSKGVYRATFDTEKAEFSNLHLAFEVESPSYIEKSGDNLYVASEFKNSLVTAKLQQNNQYQQISSVSTQGKDPCYVCLDDKNQLVILSNYSSGDNFAAKLDNQGNTLVDQSNHQLLKQEQLEKSTHERQEGPHSHSITQIPNTDLFLSCDLGADILFLYELNRSDLTLSLIQKIKTPQHSGPRHIAFNDKLNAIYVVGELDSTVIVYSLDVEKKEIVQKNQFKTLTEQELKEESYPSHIIVRNEFLYVANRFINTFTVFKISNDYDLELIQTIKYGGDFPRHFQFTPDNKFILTADQLGDTITALKVLQNGQLELTQKQLKTSSPTYILL